MGTEVSQALLCIPLLHRRAHLRRRFASVQSIGRFFIYWHFRESECPQPDWLFCSVGPPAAGGTSEVLVEDAVVEAGKRMGLKEDTWTSMAGYAWVWVFTSFSLVYSVDELKNPAQAGHLTGEGMGALATLIGVVTDRVFGVQLAQHCLEECIICVIVWLLLDGYNRGRVTTDGAL
ncbi:hypothetical protein PISMIDRAFT_626541 [Pisolithus microcarpus 441]|uniref:Unplaced genomic scaffold scaffold_99, whole genome shotgun sequence n=1 Tax=Pisolithus microcarpus 441 TaxID=765257 RepID=A0A0C9Y4A7_9AGAM|nr:hypothetical protein PISMIDRAFT_626541 [Pisolithus microcarpus 441]